MAGLAGLELLPAELIYAIAEHLSIIEFRNLRLTCQAIANASRPLLSLIEFKGLPFRNEAQRLYELSQIPSCACRIRALSFNLSRLDDYTALHQVFSLLWFLDEDVRGERTSEERARFFRARQLFDSAGPFQDHLIQPALENLLNVRSLCLTWSRCPWRIGEGLSHFFNTEASLRNSQNATVVTQQAFLDALWDLNIPLESLTIEGLMIEGLTLRNQGQGETFKALSTVKRLHLIVVMNDVDPFPCSKLDQLISMMPLLTDLRMEFMPPSGTPQILDFLPTAHLPNLETFYLASLGYETSQVVRFLLRHSGTIKTMRLSALTAAWESEWPLICDEFVHLENFEVSISRCKPWIPDPDFQIVS